MVFKSPLMIEQHIHGAFGVDFNTAQTVDEVIFVSEKLYEYGIGGLFPTLVTDSIENLKKQIELIKKASLKTDKILGIHLEGVFINPEKKGIHNPQHFLPLTAENYKLIEDDFIKIITLAPELDEGLINYLKGKVKIQAGHCIGNDFSQIDGITHLFNTMPSIHHREKSSALSALLNDNIYTEIIADGVHLSDEILKLIFKTRPLNKIILISDALPITKSELKEIDFADSKIYYDGTKATSKDGVIAGSTSLLNDIVKYLSQKDLFHPEFITNVYEYHNITPKGEITWDEDWNIIEIH